MNWLRNWSTPPKVSDPEEALRATLIHWMTVTSIIVVLGLAALAPLVESDLGFAMSIYLGSLAGAIAVFVLLHLFAGGERPTCMKTADSNDDGEVNLADAIFLPTSLFAAPSSPSVFA